MPRGNYHDVTTGWVARSMGNETKKVFTNDRMPVYGDAIFSYGSHFEMARPLRNRKGEFEAFLVNGDVYSKTTNRHQSEVRASIQRAEANFVIIPYPVLDEAGISFDSIKVIHRERERGWEIHHHEAQPPASARWQERYASHYVPWTEVEKAAVMFEDYVKQEAGYLRNLSYGFRERAKGRTDTFWDRHTEQSRPVLRTWEQAANWEQQYGRKIVDPPTRHLVVGHRDVTINDDGTYEWDTYHHQLAESVIEATVEYVVWRKCPDCGGTGKASPSNDLDNNAHTYASDCYRCYRVRGKVSVIKHRTARFLSGFDSNETRPAYFFCELPDRKATTVAEAYESLKPKAIKELESWGLDIKRQGDIFAAPAPGITLPGLRKSGATVTKGGYILGTNHKATETAVLPDGTTLVRGTLTHAPARRRADHKRVTVGKDWHVVLKNTVPVSK